MSPWFLPPLEPPPKKGPKENSFLLCTAKSFIVQCGKIQEQPMIAMHIHQALAQVHELKMRVINAQRFTGYSGRCRIIGGTLALLAPFVLGAPWYPQTPVAHLAGWGLVLGVSVVANYSAVLYWFLFSPEARRDARRLDAYGIRPSVPGCGRHSHGGSDPPGRLRYLVWNLDVPLWIDEPVLPPGPAQSLVAIRPLLYWMRHHLLVLAGSVFHQSMADGCRVRRRRMDWRIHLPLQPHAEHLLGSAALSKGRDSHEPYP